MSETVDSDLYTRTKALLEPGDIELLGCIVHTNLAGEEDLEMHELTVAANEVIADHAGKGETYIEAGNDDTAFSSNQFQGRTLDDEAFVWECQQLLRDGTFDIVFYYEANVDQESLAADLADLDGVDGVTQVP
jgi:Zn/Cd-binding protein ZinT